MKTIREQIYEILQYETSETDALVDKILALLPNEQAMRATSDILPWHPIEEFTQLLPWDPSKGHSQKIYGDEAGFLLLAPELIDGDCNVHGVGMGYWQDDRDVPSDESGAIREEGVDYGGWLACRWSMSNDEWREVPCTPTHYLRLRGVGA